MLLVLDCMHLNRQLMLAAPILSLGLPTLVLLNMSDLIADRGGKMDTLALAHELGHPVALISAAKGTGMGLIRNFLEQFGEFPLTRPGSGTAAHPSDVRPRAASGLAQVYDTLQLRAARVSAVDAPPRCHPAASHLRARSSFWSSSSRSSRSSSASASRSAMVWALCSRASGVHCPTASGQLDSRAAARWPVERRAVGAGLPSADPSALPLHRSAGGFGLPARAALIADRVMRAIGLNGKAFIPLLSAYACAVPAIMATRTIENKRERMATISSLRS